MVDKNNDGRDDTAKNTTGPAVTKVVVKDLPIAPANSTPGYSAGNPDAKETPADKVAPYSTPAHVEPAKVPVVSPVVTAEKVAAKIAVEKKYDDRARELDLARRALDGSGTGTRLGQDTNNAFVRHDLTNLTTLEEIDRQSAILNKERQDKRTVEQDKQSERADNQVAVDADKRVADTDKRVTADDKRIAAEDNAADERNAKTTKFGIAKDRI